MFDKSIKRSEKLARSNDNVGFAEGNVPRIDETRIPAGSSIDRTTLENYRKVAVRDWKIAENCLFVLCTVRR